jgi:hypothetical protein
VPTWTRQPCLPRRSRRRQDLRPPLPRGAGQSDGGFATLGLIAQTSRFRTAIASASFSDLVSLYGTFYGQYRYGDAGEPQTGQVFRMLQLEKDSGGLGGPPWLKSDRYRADSAILQADKVQTPLMLVHGDLDFIPVQQAEEFFTALYRQDKRADFVRYQGEWHEIANRENVLDLWRRIASWLARRWRRASRHASLRARSGAGDGQDRAHIGKRLLVGAVGRDFQSIKYHADMDDHRSEEDVAAKLRIALDMFGLGESTMRQKLRQTFPAASAPKSKRRCVSGFLGVPEPRMETPPGSAKKNSLHRDVLIAARTCCRVGKVFWFNAERTIID